MLRLLLAKLDAVLRRRRMDAELDEEIDSHLAMATEEFVRQGMTREAARRAALKSFGGVDQVRERHREARGLPWLDDFGRDFTLALRTLVRERGFSGMTIATLAIAIGANAAVLSVVDAVLIRPLPYLDSDRVVTVRVEGPEGTRPQARFTGAGYRFFREAGRSFEELGTYNLTQLVLTGAGDPMRTSVVRISSGAFDVLGVSPQLGRLPDSVEDAPDGPPVILLSHELWATQFRSDPNVIGRTVELNDTTREVIGVMPPEFFFPSVVDVWIPLQLELGTPDAANFVFGIVGRLRPGVSLESASVEVEALIARLPEVGHDPGSVAVVLPGRAEVLTMKEFLVGNSRYPLMIVLGAVSLVLLIALANVTSLFLVREEARAPQRALRAALGASGGRLARHAFAEAALLAGGGALLGLLLASAGTRALVEIGPTSIPRLDEVGVGPLVWVYAAAVSIVAALQFTLVPTRGDGSLSRLAIALSAAGRNATAGPERLRLRGVLVATQVALAVVLLIASGLVARSYGNLRSVDPGFDPSDLVTFNLLLPAARYTNAEAAPLYQRLVEDLEALPGIEAAAVTRGLPITPIQAAYTLAVDGHPNEREPFVVRWVTPGYFETMGIPVVAGRTMQPGDANEFRVFINSAFAERFWTVESAVGKRVAPGRDPLFEVVGVVGDDRIRGLDVPLEPAAYVPINAPRSPAILFVSVVVRTPRSAEDLAPELRRAVASLDPELPLIDIQAMDEVIAESFAVSRTSFLMLLLGIAAVVSLILGAVGIYGVIAYVVSRRTPEIGLRLALGAEPRHIWSRVIGRGALPAMIGVVAGIGIALVGSRVLSSLLFETSPRDLATFLAGPAALLLVAVAASVVPARHALLIDPARALRSE